jgi:hypothetical protein
MVLVLARQGGCTAVRQFLRTLKTKLNLKGAIRLESTQTRWFSKLQGREAGQGGQRYLRESWSAALSSQATYLNRTSDSPKGRLSLLFIKGC